MMLDHISAHDKRQEMGWFGYVPNRHTKGCPKSKKYLYIIIQLGAKWKGNTLKYKYIYMWLKW